MHVLNHITPPLPIAVASSLHSIYTFKTVTANLGMWTSDGVISALLQNSVPSLLLGPLTKLVCSNSASVLQKHSRCSEERAGSCTVFTQIFLCQMTQNVCWTGQDLGERRGKAVSGFLTSPGNLCFRVSIISYEDTSLAQICSAKQNLHSLLLPNDK